MVRPFIIVLWIRRPASQEVGPFANAEQAESGGFFALANIFGKKTDTRAACAKFDSFGRTRNFQVSQVGPGILDDILFPLFRQCAELRRKTRKKTAASRFPASSRPCGNSQTEPSPICREIGKSGRTLVTYGTKASLADSLRAKQSAAFLSVCVAGPKAFRFAGSNLDKGVVPRGSVVFYRDFDFAKTPADIGDLLRVPAIRRQTVRRGGSHF